MKLVKIWKNNKIETIVVGVLATLGLSAWLAIVIPLLTVAEGEAASGGATDIYIGTLAAPPDWKATVRVRYVGLKAANSVTLHWWRPGTRILPIQASTARIERHDSFDWDPSTITNTRGLILDVMVVSRAGPVTVNGYFYDESGNYVVPMHFDHYAADDVGPLFDIPVGKIFQVPGTGE